MNLKSTNRGGGVKTTLELDDLEVHQAIKEFVVSRGYVPKTAVLKQIEHFNGIKTFACVCEVTAAKETSTEPAQSLPESTAQALTD